MCEQDWTGLKKRGEKRQCHSDKFEDSSGGKSGMDQIKFGGLSGGCQEIQMKVNESLKKKNKNCICR